MTLNIEAELAALDRASALDEKFHFTMSKHAARLAAAVQLESAKTLADASDSLRRSIDNFTTASDKGTQELAKWTAHTATWTKWLTVATFALFGAMVLQTIVMIFHH